MIHKPTSISIPIQTLSPFIPLFILLLSSSFSSADRTQTQNRTQNQNPPSTAMKVHPVPRKPNITVLSTGKNLRRLPHIFSRVLELPFLSDADVSVEETSEWFRFVAETDCADDVRAHLIEIHPGVTKIVIRGDGFVGLSLDELELDRWRFRLPETTVPELASAVCVDGELVVTVPKMGQGDGDGFRGDLAGRLVLVQ